MTALFLALLDPAVAWWLVLAFVVLVVACGRAWWRDIDARRTAEGVALGRGVVIAEQSQRMAELRRRLFDAEQQWAADQDAGALDRLHAMAAREGLHPTLPNGQIDPRNS